MSVEQRVEQRQLGVPIEIHKPQLEKNLTIRAATWLLRAPLTHASETIGSATPREYAPDFADKYIGAIQDGCIPIVIANHSSDAEGLPMAYFLSDLVLVANEILPEDRKLKDFRMITAASLRDGTQRAGEKIIYDGLQKFLNGRYVIPEYTVTKGDKKRGVEAGREQSEEFKDEMEDVTSSGRHGVFLFPAGNVDAGRLGEDGKRKGMQKFIPGAITTYVSMIKEQTGKDAVIIPVAFSHGEDVFDHKYKKPRPTLKGLMAGFGLADPKIIQMRIGSPIRTDDESVKDLFAKGRGMARKKAEEICARAVAEMLPPEERGDYASLFL